MFLRRLQHVLKSSWRFTSKPDVVTTSGKRYWIYNVLQTCDLHCLEDVSFTTSWRHPIYVILKTSNLRLLIYDILRTSEIPLLESIWFTSFWRCRIFDVLSTSNLRRLQDVRFSSSLRRPIYDVFCVTMS